MKRLVEIDKKYKQMENLATEERQKYCEKLIDKTQAILTNNASLLTLKQKQSLKE